MYKLGKLTLTSISLLGWLSLDDSKKFKQNGMCFVFYDCFNTGALISFRSWNFNKTIITNISFILQKLFILLACLAVAAADVSHLKKPEYLPAKTNSTTVVKTSEGKPIAAPPVTTTVKPLPVATAVPLAKFVEKQLPLSASSKLPIPVVSADLPIASIPLSQSYSGLNLAHSYDALNIGQSFDSLNFGQTYNPLPLAPSYNAFNYGLNYDVGIPYGQTFDASGYPYPARALSLQSARIATPFSGFRRNLVDTRYAANGGYLYNRRK